MSFDHPPRKNKKIDGTSVVVVGAVFVAACPFSVSSSAVVLVVVEVEVVAAHIVSSSKKSCLWCCYGVDQRHACM